MEESIWRACSSCKKGIAFGGPHWTCSVSTCNRKNTGFVFCSLACWDAHLPTMNHRDPWAEEQRAPTEAAWRAEQQAAASAEAERPAGGAGGGEEGERPRRRIVRRDAPAAAAASDDVPREVLIVASRLKTYVQARAGMNTSDRVLPGLSDIVRAAVDEAIENARRDERKTVLDRDVPPVRR